MILNFIVLGITKIFPDATGTTMVFIDDKSDAFVYNPVSWERFYTNSISFSFIPRLLPGTEKQEGLGGKIT